MSQTYPQDGIVKGDSKVDKEYSSNPTESDTQPQTGLVSMDIETDPTQPTEAHTSPSNTWLSYFKAHVEDVNYADHSNVPKLSYLELFKIFLSFGCRAFGGPVAQIAMMKEELVEKEKWISVDRFNRVYAVYQVLPGPEATELACYFGYISRGRIGALIGGFGFLLPGVLIMLLWSYLYTTYGIDNRQTLRSFRCIQNTIAASIFRSTYKLADAALNDVNKSTKKKIFNT